MHHDSTHLAARSPTTRARVTNDLRRLHGEDGRSRVGRRRRDLVAIFLDALGGTPTDLQALHVRKAVELTATAEAVRAKVLAGDAGGANLELLVKLEGEARRAIRSLGIRADQPPRGLTLGDLLREDAETGDG
jgi:hypothetical protein